MRPQRPEICYSAGAGNAFRYLYVNGAAVVTNASFPTTGNCDTWNTIAIPNSPLHAGVNTVSVIFDPSKGSSNWLNLDEAALRYPLVP